jgi:hypothetical protein
MANQKISQLDAVTVAESADLLPIVVGGVTKRITAQSLKTEGLRLAEHVVTAVTTTQTINLSTTKSVNVIKVSNPGLTLTLQFPTSPVEAQVCQFTTLTNTVTLIVGTGGSFSIDPSFAGAPTAGFKATYAYHDSDNTWYLIG